MNMQQESLAIIREAALAAENPEVAKALAELESATLRGENRRLSLFRLRDDLFVEMAADADIGHPYDMVDVVKKDRRMVDIYAIYLAMEGHSLVVLGDSDYRREQIAHERERLASCQ